MLLDASGDDRRLLTFLALAYKYKELNDYGIGRSAGVAEGEAHALIEAATEFLRRVTKLIEATDWGTEK